MEPMPTPPAFTRAVKPGLLPALRHAQLSLSLGLNVEGQMLSPKDAWQECSKSLLEQV